MRARRGPGGAAMQIRFEKRAGNPSFAGAPLARNPVSFFPSFIVSGSRRRRGCCCFLEPFSSPRCTAGAPGLHPSHRPARRPRPPPSRRLRAPEPPRDPRPGPFFAGRRRPASPGPRRPRRGRRRWVETPLRVPTGGMRRGLQPPASPPMDSPGSPAAVAVSLPARLAAAFIQIRAGAPALGPPWVRACFPGAACGVAQGARPVLAGRGAAGGGPALSDTPRGPDGGGSPLLLHPDRESSGGRPSVMRPAPFSPNLGVGEGCTFFFVKGVSIGCTRANFARFARVHALHACKLIFRRHQLFQPWNGSPDCPPHPNLFAVSGVSPWNKSGIGGRG